MTNRRERILLVDDDEDIKTIIRDRFEKLGYNVLTAGNGQDALRIIDMQDPDAVILDLQMPRMDGMEVIRRLKDNSQLPVIVLTAFGTILKAVEAMKAGAYDFVTKPFSHDHLEVVVKKALDYRALQTNNLYLQGEVDAAFQGIMGESPKIREALEMAQKVAGTSSTVLLLGGSGTGKEMFSRSIHRWSDRAGKPFVVVNSVALRDELLESELFGHEKGAFTGAYALKRGKLEIADRGTVFFDEIGDLKLELQAKLLRVLQEREFERVGGNRTIRVDIRMIAATNQNLYKKVQEGEFRDDLFYRLNVVAIQIPLLRERKEDIPALAHFFLTCACREMKRSLMEFSPEAVNHLMGYHWPGNVRELKNLIERAVVLADGKEIHPHDLPLPPFNNHKRESSEIQSYHEAVRQFQTEIIQRAMEQAGGNQSRAADLLKLQRTYLARLIRKLNIRNKIIAGLFIMIIFFTINLTQAYGMEIAVIRSQGLPIYQEAVVGIKSIYKGKIREYDLKGDLNQSGNIVSEVRRHPPDAIIAVGLLATVVAKDNFKSTPVVFCMVLNPDRFSISGNNLTGVTLNISSSETVPRLRELFPSARRIGVLYDPGKTGMLEQEKQIAQSWGFTLITREVPSIKMLSDAFSEIQHNIDLLWLIPDSTVVTPESLEFIFLRAFENNIPVITFSKELLSRGAVLTFSPDYSSIGEEAGRLVNQILQGKKPADLPIRPVKKIKTSINLVLAKKMGVEINQAAIYAMRDQIEIFNPAKTAQTNYPGR